MHLDFGVRHARVVPSVQKNAQEMVFVTMENVRKYFFFFFSLFSFIHNRELLGSCYFHMY